MAKAGSTEKVVREIRRHTRRRFSAEEKIRIVLEGLRGEESIAALCRREGLAPNLYYRWSKEFLEAGKKRLLGDTTREATSTEVQDLRRENSQLKQVVAEAVLENRVLKKIWWSPVRGTIRATDRGREARDHPACGGLGSVGAPRRRTRKHTVVPLLQSVQTLRFELFHRAAPLVRPGGKTRLRMTDNLPTRQTFTRIANALASG